jgi:hypothetical protein
MLGRTKQLSDIDAQGEASRVEVSAPSTRRARARYSSALLGLILVLLLGLPLAGCVSKKQSDARVRAAYRAGRRDAIAQMQLQQQVPSMADQDTEPASESETVSVSGPVRNPVLPWRSTMTIREALVNSGYSGPAEPTDLVLVRGGVAFRVAPEQMDEPLLPGDTLRVH